MEKNNVFYATGKRKTAIAKTWLKPGKGSITVNDKPVDEYFTVPSAKRLLIEPMVMTNTLDQYDVVVRVVGGGVTGQASAIRHGITKALIGLDAEFRAPLKRAGFVRRDPRIKERKKYGQRGARARFQFSKR